MTPEEIRECYGDEYPAALKFSDENGEMMRFERIRESRFLRSYKRPGVEEFSSVSRFADGTASLTLKELKDAWWRWSEREQHDLIEALRGISPEEVGEGLNDILRFILDYGNDLQCCMVAGIAAHRLPQEEAFRRLEVKLLALEGPFVANVVESLATMRRPEALPLLRAHLEKIWSRQRSIFQQHPHINIEACNVVRCIASLLELGAAPDEFAHRVWRLSEHPNKSNRETVKSELGVFYPWLNPSDD